MYLTPEGAFVVTSFNSDMSSKEENMGGAMIIEIATNLIFTLLLAMIVGRVGIFGSVVKGALFLGFVGMAAQVGTEISYWNWYGFSGLFASLNFIGETLAWYLTGLVICGIYSKCNRPVN